MSATVSDYLLYRLSQWGIRRIYGYPEDRSTRNLSYVNVEAPQS